MKTHNMKPRRKRARHATLGRLTVTLREDRRYLHLKARKFRLGVVYRGYDRDIDRQLFKLVGRWSDGSGCWLTGSHQGERDHDWLFASRTAALAAARRVLRAKRSGRLIVVGLRVQVIGPLVIQ